MVQKVYQERNILKKLKHPNIVKLHASFTSKRHIYLVFEYISMGNLENFIKKGKKVCFELWIAGEWNLNQ